MELTCEHYYQLFLTILTQTSLNIDLHLSLLVVECNKNSIHTSEHRSNNSLESFKFLENLLKSRIIQCGCLSDKCSIFKNCSTQVETYVVLHRIRPARSSTSKYDTSTKFIVSLWVFGFLLSFVPIPRYIPLLSFSLFKFENVNKVK